jgi:hypothetical protein
MAIISVISPDKISIAMFLSFMKFCLGKEYKTGAIHSLMTKEEIENYISSLMSNSDKVIFSYYAKRQKNADPLKITPSKIIDVSNMIIWINLYSTEWVVLKDDANQAPYYIDRWNKNMEKMKV